MAAAVEKISEREQRAQGWRTFEADIEARANEIASQLPSNVSRDRFINAVIAAVKATPDLLTATPRSLMSAVTKAAQDGLLPDGREGIITIYRQKIPNSKPEQHEIVAQWNPMFYGIRKRAREIDGIIIDAQVVVDGDEFEFELGDAPRIYHRPKVRADAVEAAAGVAVYAIFRHPEQGILHREVMWKPEVFATMNQSRAKGSLMWTVFWTEGWKKACGRRGSKSVPMSAPLQQIIQRDDENFSFQKDHAVTPRPTMPEIPGDEPKAIEQKTVMSMPAIPDTVGAFDDRRPQESLHNFDRHGDAENEVADTSDVGRFLADLDGTLATARDVETLERLFVQSGVEEALAGNDDDLDRAYVLRLKHLDRFEQGDDGEYSFDE